MHSALKAMRTTIRELDFRHQTQLSLVDIARRVNPLLRGWIEYYGRYAPCRLWPPSIPIFGGRRPAACGYRAGPAGRTPHRPSLPSTPFPATTGARCDPRWCARRGQRRAHSLGPPLSSSSISAVVPPRPRRTAEAAHGMAAPPPTQNGVVSGALSILDARDAGGSSWTRIPSV